ncbi:MAG TPA: hypothetical protein VGM06_12465 [Polyangiaceae bacterium]|jgi:hypothetical protein
MRPGRLARRLAWLVLALAALVTTPRVSRADERDPDAVRIAAAGHSLKWNWTPPGRSDRYGHAETLVHAPVAAVRARVLDFGRYHEIMPDKFRASRVIAHGPDGSADVYVQIAILHGMVLLWDVTRFAPAHSMAPGLDVIEGRMVSGKGNIEDLSVVWTLHALDDDWTVLKLDLLLKPGLPAPQSAVDEELRDSAMNAVDAIHDRAQGTQGIDAW